MRIDRRFWPVRAARHGQRWVAAIGCSLLLAAPGQAAAHAAARDGASLGSAPGNVEVSHDRYPAHAEPYLAINPRHPTNLLGAAQLLDRSAIPVAGTFSSFDGGRTWHDHGPLPAAVPNTASLDVTVAFNASGSGFVAALVASISGGRIGPDTRIVIWRTDDGGRSFHHPITVARGQRLDHPWLAVDPAGRSFYLVWVDQITNRIDCSRSLDGGHTFSSPRLLYQAAGVAGDPVVTAGRGGMMSTAFHVRPGSGPISIQVVTSLDYGRSFTRSRPLPQPQGTALFYGGRQQPSSLISLASDPRNRTLYVSYASSRLDMTHTDILLSRSTDGGQTWTHAMRVNHDAESDQTINHQPQVAVDSAGTVFVSYFALAHGQIDLYVSESTSRGSDFSPGLRITTRAFDPRLGITVYRSGYWWIGDYQGLAAGPRGVNLLWNDTRTGHLEIFAARLSLTEILRAK